MKAVVFTEYGSPDVLNLLEIAKPVPVENQVLIKVHTAAMNAADWHIMRADPFLARLAFGLRRPKQPTTPGNDAVGVVEAVGSQVTQFKVGDVVFGEVLHAGRGAYAEYVCASEDVLALKPAGISMEQAATLPVSGITALSALRNKGQLKAGQHVLIHGASGGVGTFAVQIAKALGAEVTAVCSTAKADLVRSLGADHIIDYKREDFAQRDTRYDLIVAVNGDRSIFDYRRALKPEGIYVMVGGTNKQIFQALFLGSLLSMFGKQKLIALTIKTTSADLTTLAEMVESGKVTPVMDRSFRLQDIREAMHYLEAGHATGKITVQVAAS